jgi:hypothetical protein
MQFAASYAEFASMVPVSGVLIRIRMLLAKYSLDYRLGINHGILCRKYHCCYIVVIILQDCSKVVV